MGKSSLAMTLMFFDYQSITFRFTINVRQFGDQLSPICVHRWSIEIQRDKTRQKGLLERWLAINK